jgi:hypothetical protein
LRAEITNPNAVVGHDFDAQSIGPEQLTYLPFIASLIHGALRGFVGRQQQDRSELGRSTDNVHLDIKQVFLYAEFGIGISYQSFSDMPAMLRPGIKRLER